MDNTKRQKFIEAACTNPAHPVYKVGWQRSPILQHYALNVLSMQYMKPAQWFETVAPDWLDRVDKAIALCEAGEQEEQAKVSELDALKAEVAALKSQMNKAEEPDEPKPDDKKDEEDEAPESIEAETVPETVEA